MSALTLLLAVLVTLPAIGAALWTWRAMQSAMNMPRISAGLEVAHLDIGSWPASNCTNAT
jgi:hypothetical protein